MTVISETDPYRRDVMPDGSIRECWGEVEIVPGVIGPFRIVMATKFVPKGNRALNVPPPQSKSL